LIRILLKLPNPSLPFFILRRIPELEGILWAMIMPILLISYLWFSMWSFPHFTLLFGYPLNVISAFLIPAVIFAFFLRMQLERVILSWRSINRSSREWDPTRRVEELIDVLKKQQRRAGS
jgi:hypothetical protein